ncbi:DUF4231 domain-containing protein [Mesorhizobium sp.]|uniref:DUF4231 domain-containing protein n=1 Tax=Mesorhizobium sp. TaxID=1871066 RepID=UPI000FE3ECB7|nr:DUF4231 domain-containing protein [Mesorhizobium sp.]RWK29335.1 MAG: DUF4231 domain-containing protein [Mesorhizobium sp.]RWM08160.1 MAG: DUF4231 domain-containing protein [Mesorhizobium sp.]TIP06254.1 MAG: DUF4231 domain-containing protein [Mesorhizobium sp.]TIP20170.1 MAG: DUF4231 domain-containing protein [Mesorhizobium sp.]TJV84455.1 MAG: DUF4231 domain-containing protein [Mesorhizobium sp.]
MNREDFPALYLSADEASAAAQSTHLNLIRAQFALLVAASGLSISFDRPNDIYLLYLLVVAISTALLIYMAVKKPERDWYACRALAESIKTSTWRYMMRAEPFDGDNENETKRKFSEFLNQILKLNSHIQEPISKRPRTGHQITKAMENRRLDNLNERKNIYRRLRIDDQRNWYVKRTRSNRLSFRFWVILCVVVQGSAICLAAYRILHNGALDYWPTEPLLVFASSIIGWIQIKKFNELATAYSLTSHEIGIASTRLDDVHSESEFSDFVNDTERAFSREHTQWVARLTE